MATSLSIDNVLTKTDDFDEIYTTSFVWLNSTPINDESRDAEKNLNSISSHMNEFQDVEQCRQYIEKQSPTTRLAMIVSGQLGREIVPYIHAFQQIISIYVYCLDIEGHKPWTSKFSKIKTVEDNLDKLISQIERDHKIQKILEPISNEFFTIADKSTVGLNGKFVFLQVFIDCLLRLKTSQKDKVELINRCRQQYEGNASILNDILEFDQHYSSEKVLKWYTRESFFFKMLNSALRTEDIHLIFLFRTYISDIRSHLKHYQIKNSIKVYRGQLISDNELNNLKRCLNRLISVNSFFSTTLDRQRALSFLNTADVPRNLQRVLFEIDADPAVVTTKPFANISECGEYPEELEVLFMLGSIFRLNSANYCSIDRVWIIKMALCNDDEHDSKDILTYMKQQLDNGQINLRTLGKVLWTMGKFDLAEQYINRLLEELSPNDPLICSLYEDLALTASQTHDYMKSIQWHQKILNLKNSSESDDVEDIQMLNSRLNQSAFDEIQSKITIINKENEQLQKEKQELDKERAEQKTDNQQLRCKVDNLEKCCEEFKSDIHGWKEKTQLLQKSSENLSKRIAIYQEQLQLLEEHNRTLDQQITTNQQQFQRQEEKNKDLNECNTTYQQQIQHLKDNNRNLDEQNAANIQSIQLLEENNKNFNEQIATHQEEIRHLEENNKKFNEHITKDRQQLQDLKENKNDLENQITTYQQRIQHLEENNENLTEQNAAHYQRIQDLEKDHENFIEQITLYQEENELLDEHKKNLEDLIEDYQEDNAVLEKSKKDLEDLIATYEQRIQRLEEDNNNINEQSKTYLQQIHLLNKSNQNLKDQITTHQQQIQLLDENNKNLNKRITTDQQQTKLLEERNNNLSEQISAYEQQIQGLEERNTTLTERVTTNEQKVQLLEQDNRSLNEQSAIDKQIIQRLRQKNRVMTLPADARWAEIGVTVAGSGYSGDGADELCYPEGLCLIDDADDHQTTMIVVADGDNNRIIQWKMDDTENGEVIVGGNGRGNQLNLLSEPCDVLFDKETDSFIIADKGNWRVIQWPRCCEAETQGKALIENVNCQGLFMDDQRYLYVSDLSCHGVRRYPVDEVGNMKGTLVAGGNGQGSAANQLNWPTQIYVDQELNVYVSDSYNHRVMKWSKDARKGIAVAGDHGEGSSLRQLSYPCGLFVDHSSTVYVADMGNSRVVRWTEGATEGIVVVEVNDKAEEKNKQGNPRGLSIDRRGNLYVVDRNNHCVQRFALT